MPSAAAKVIDPTPPEKPYIDVAKPQAKNNIDAALLKIAMATKTSPLKIMRDFVSLAFGPGKVSFQDYSRLRLFDTAFWANTDRRTVAGRKCSAAIYHNVNYRYGWWGLVENKIASDSYLAAYNIPTIPTVALYHQNLNTGGAVARDNQQLRDILTDESNYPMFGKPTEGIMSLGSVGLLRYLPSEKCLEKQDMRLVPLDEFVGQLSAHYASGYLFQKLVSPHAAIHSLCGDRLATVRIVTLVNDTGPKVFRACWKIPAGTNMADNYWRQGNLLAQIDISCGQVLRVFSGSGLDLVQVDHHPDSGIALAGFQIPHWQRTLDTVIEAARLMQHVPLIGWDVAVINEGPVIVEMNQCPDFTLPQLADGRGIMEPELTELMTVQQQKRAEFKKANARAFKEQ